MATMEDGLGWTLHTARHAQQASLSIRSHASCRLISASTCISQPGLQRQSCKTSFTGNILSPQEGQSAYLQNGTLGHTMPGHVSESPGHIPLLQVQPLGSFRVSTLMTAGLHDQPYCLLPVPLQQRDPCPAQCANAENTSVDDDMHMSTSHKQTAGKVLSLFDSAVRTRTLGKRTCSSMHASARSSCKTCSERSSATGKAGRRHPHGQGQQGQHAHLVKRQCCQACQSLILTGLGPDLWVGTPPDPKRCRP